MHIAAGTWINLNLHLFNLQDNAVTGESGILVKTIPAGDPQNPLEARWMAFHDGQGIHGTADLASLRRVLEAGLGSRADALAVANAGLESLHDRMRVAADGEHRLTDWPAGGPGLGTAEVAGTGEPLPTTEASTRR